MVIMAKSIHRDQTHTQLGEPYQYKLKGSLYTKNVSRFVVFFTDNSCFVTYLFLN